MVKIYKTVFIGSFETQHRLQLLKLQRSCFTPSLLRMIGIPHGRAVSLPTNDDVLPLVEHNSMKISFWLPALLDIDGPGIWRLP